MTRADVLTLEKQYQAASQKAAVVVKAGSPLPQIKAANKEAHESYLRFIDAQVAYGGYPSASPELHAY